MRWDHSLRRSPRAILVAARARDPRGAEARPLPPPGGSSLWCGTESRADPRGDPVRLRRDRLCTRTTFDCARYLPQMGHTLNAMASGVRYVKSRDGVSLACWTRGMGPPLIYVAGGPWTHLRIADNPQADAWLTELGRERTVVLYDMRGTGLSQRDVSDFTLDAHVADVEAIVAAFGLDTFELFGAVEGGAIAAAFAARHPKTVSRLVLWCAWAQTAYAITGRIRSWASLIEQDWGLMAETCAHLAMGWSGGETGRQGADELRTSVAPEVMIRAMRGIGQFDVTDELSSIHAPCLVLHRRDVEWLSVDVARQLAASIPDARLVLVAGEATVPYLGDSGLVLEALREFQGADAQHLAARQGLANSAPAESDSGGPRVDGLTEREVEVLRLIAAGLSNNDIAKQLCISVRTVERHIGNVYGKIKTRGRANATIYAIRNGLIAPH